MGGRIGFEPATAWTIIASVWKPHLGKRVSVQPPGPVGGAFAFVDFAQTREGAGLAREEAVSASTKKPNSERP